MHVFKLDRKLKEGSQFNFKSFFKLIWFLWGNEKRKNVFWLSILLIVSFYNLVPPYIEGKVIDFVDNYNKGDGLERFYYLVIVLGISAAVTAIIRLSVKKQLGDLRTDTIYNIRVKGFECLLNNPLEDRNENTGTKVQKIENGANAFKMFWQLCTNEVMMALTSSVGIISVFAFVLRKPLYTGLVLLYIFLFFFIMIFFYKRLQKVQADMFGHTDDDIVKFRVR